MNKTIHGFFCTLINLFLISAPVWALQPDCQPSETPFTALEGTIPPVLNQVQNPEEVEHSWLSDLRAHKETCADAKPQLSCPHKVENFEPLETPESGFLAKTEMLLGQKLPPDFIANGDPYAPLDFSKAPKLKGVYLASLVFRADFYGTVMARLLKYHAEHGALVNVVTTKYMMLKKDRELLEAIAASNPNFKLDEYKYHNPGNIVNKASNLVTDRLRDMHIKLFITLSDEKESDNAVVFGGRNIHDGFLFKTVPDHSKYPKLVQYGVGKEKGKDDKFVHWNDFEAKVTSKELATSTAAHLQRFLDRDKNTQAMRPFAEDQPGAGSTEQPEGTFRHFISLPFADDHALEKLYVEMIDSAKSYIKLSSPYLRPMPQVMAALKRAIQRGVKITIQTRVELKGDTNPALYEEANKESINALYKDAKIYEWKENSILHSKFLIVDGKKIVIGSVNLSRRSFVQDAENVYFIQSKDITHTMESIFDSYVQKSQLITKPLPRKKIPSIGIRLLENQF
jgi:phosphatidylserine/phosphatidylglycerophosphate/cardiolipin synthase-like enzyme